MKNKKKKRKRKIEKNPSFK